MLVTDVSKSLTCCVSVCLLSSAESAQSLLTVGIQVDTLHLWHAVFLWSQSINQSIEFTVRGREPDVTHRTSWLESTGECVWQPKAADQCLPQRKGECPADERLNQTKKSVDL